jgi:TubC N-terminal docking domain
MITILLRDLYSRDVDLWAEGDKLKFKCKGGVLSLSDKEQLKQFKSEIIQRFQENEQAKAKGFIVVDHGELYEYHYSPAGFLYIERNPDGTVSAWRENHKQEESKATNIKVIAENTTFDEALNEASGFIEWLNIRKQRKVRSA